MAKNGVQRGHVLTAIAPAGGVVSGGLYIIGTLAMIATTTQAAGEQFEGSTMGVWRLPKNPSDTATLFAKAYWDSANSRITTTSAGNTEVGVFTVIAANGDNTADVRLNGVSV